ncbi:hypothetical protein D3C87_1840610 [compost metagenome]
MCKQIDAEQMRKLGNVIKNNLPTGLGFCVMTFETGNTDTPSNYLSNCEREDMIKHLKETAERLERNKDFSTPEPEKTLQCVECDLKLPDTFQIRSIGCPNCGGVLM